VPGVGGKGWRCPSKERLPPLSAERINQTVEILKHTVDIEEKGVKLKLTIVDTPGFGDAVNNSEW
jgi:septin 5